MDVTKEKGNKVEAATAPADNHPRDATDDEIRSFPHVVGRVPLAAWAAALIGAWERFSYYCFISTWRNHVPLRSPGRFIRGLTF